VTPVAVAVTSWIHDVDVAAVKPHPKFVVTENVSDDALAPSDAVPDGSTGAQADDWVTVKAADEPLSVLATVIMPSRVGAFEAVTLYETTLPEMVTLVIHGTFDDAASTQPVPVVAARVDGPPPADALPVVAGRVTTQPLLWCTFTVWPASWTWVVRAGPVVAAPVRVTSVVPVPLVTGTVSHEVFEDAVQPHKGLLKVTWTDALPPEAGTVTSVVSSVALHPLSCVTENVRPPATNDPRRARPRLAAAE
jgi:hypothetical protein